MTKIQVRRGTASAWTTANPVLSSGEPGYETDTGKMKFGDGSTAWSGLPYFVPTNMISEIAQDALFDLLDSGSHSGIDFVYDDEAGSLSFEVIPKTLLLDAGAPVPVGTEPGTIIFRKA